MLWFVKVVALEKEQKQVLYSLDILIIYRFYKLVEGSDRSQLDKLFLFCLLFYFGKTN